MSRCSVCSNPRREDIEASLDLGWSQRAVGERFGVSASALSRHRNRHGHYQDLKRQYHRQQRQIRDLEHAIAVKTVFTRAGCRNTQEIGRMIGEIEAALIGAEEYALAAGFLRAAGSAESDTWSLIERGASMNGDSPEWVWADLYAPLEMEGADG